MRRFNCPLSLEKADRLIEVLELLPTARVVDVGCGEGEFLIRILQRYRASGTGIDPDDDAVAACQQEAGKRGVADALDLLTLKAEDVDWPEERYDAAVCIGSVLRLGRWLIRSPS